MRSIHAVAVAVLFTADLGAQTLNVPGTYPTIQAAVNAATPGATVLVAPGAYAGAVDFLGKAITVQSSGGAAVTTIVGLSTSRVVKFLTNEGAASVLDGFTITGGAGGITCQDSSPTITHCVVSGNLAFNDEGGGMRVRATALHTSSPTVTACAFHDNFSVYSGGGVFITTSASSAVAAPSFTDCLFESNTSQGNTLSAVSGGGGGCAVHGNTSGSGALNPTFLRCGFNDNVCSGIGGGLQIAFAPGAVLTSCFVVGNRTTSGGGGGVEVDGANATLKGCVIAGNIAAGTGAAVNSIAGFGGLILRSCTIAGNSGIGAVYLSGVGPGSTASFANCILWANAGVDLIAVGFTPSVTYCDIGGGSGASGAGNISTDPLFVNAAFGDYHLAPNSPCRDAGNVAATSLPATDFDGGPRIVGPAPDLGADEIPAAALPGTSEDLALYLTINNSGDPNASSASSSAGDLVTMTLTSPTQSLVGGALFIGAEAFLSGSPLPDPLNLPGVHLDLGSLVSVAGTLLGPPVGLAPEGLSLYTLVPPGLSGITVRLQGFVVSAAAANGLYVATNAHEVVF